MTDPIRVAVVDDHPLFREGVAISLKAHKMINVVGQGASAGEALALCATSAPDVLLLDISMPGGGSLEATRIITRDFPDTKVVILTASEHEQHISTALSAGARGYVLKGVGINELINTVISIQAGQTYVSPSLAAKLLTQMHKRLTAEPKTDVSALSPREEQILDRVTEGLTNKEIARKLDISEKTVKHYMTSIMQKLQVRNRVEAVIAAKSRRDSKGPQGPRQ